MEYVQVVRDLGLPVVIILALGYAIWTCGIWIGSQVVIPLRDRHFSFLTSLEKTLEVIADCQKEIHTRINELQCLKGERRQ